MERKNMKSEFTGKTLGKFYEWKPLLNRRTAGVRKRNTKAKKSGNRNTIAIEIAPIPPDEGPLPPRPLPAPSAARVPQPPKPGFTNSLVVDKVPSDPEPGGGVAGGAGVAAVPMFTSTQ